MKSFVDQVPVSLKGVQIVPPVRKVLMFGLFCTALINSTAGLAVESGVASQAAQTLVRNVYQPYHQQFHDSTQHWLDSTNAFCDAPDAKGALALQQAFSVLVTDFARVELYRVGPLLEENRQNRLFYWPDKRRVGERQLRAFLASANLDALQVSDMEKKSVALQGLPAIERLLFSKSSHSELVDGNSDDYCQALQLVAGNVSRIAQNLNTAWESDSTFVVSLLNPAQGALSFRSETEVLRSILTQIVVGLDVVLNRKILPLVNSDPVDVRKAPLWLSENTATMLDGNLRGIRALLLESGLAKQAGLEKELAFEFDNALLMLNKLQAIPQLQNENGVVNADAFALFRSLSAVVGSIAFTVTDRFSSALGVSAGFNSEDGD